ncbi:MAG: metallophosphoesterase [Symploca sp. SIO3C6]|nr:metallophosphoesterase [Symploca sp. SIO3C6]NET08538.1 metallophosphoesterase [Symploca sp. SIO2B6]
MDIVSDPPISVKIDQMKERVLWQHPLIVERGIDQTRLAFADNWADSPEFSFLVIGDTGSGPHQDCDPQRQIAQYMLEHSDSCRFLLHTGDVIYLVGSREHYQEKFIKPYREFLLGGEQPHRLAYDRMVFNLPFLPVLGNHDYYNLPFLFGLLNQVTLPLRRLLGLEVNLHIGWHGSAQGDAYARAFMDYLKALDSNSQLCRHLESHYTAKTDSGRCLVYEPGNFTRLPNRYYSFRNGGIDFFALDSNTFSTPSPLPATAEGDAYRRLLAERRHDLEQQELQLLETASTLHSDSPESAEYLDDLQAKLEQIEEIKLDIHKQLVADETTTTIDFEQLKWLRKRLIESWHTNEVRGRVIYFHHPPYVTEVTKWHQAQTLAVRHNLRWVLDGVAGTVGSMAQGRPLVDLIICGHAHCLEYLRTGDTGHADSHLNWLICGGSGFSLRRQREEGSEIMESFPMIESTKGNYTRLVAQSELFVGLSGNKSHKRRPYSFLRIDVQDGCPPKFIIRPFIAQRFEQHWSNSQLEPFIIPLTPNRL